MENVKVVKFEPSRELKVFAKAMKEMLLNGKIISEIPDEESADIIAKITEINIYGNYFYAIWERNIHFNEGWRLLYIRTSEDVESVWDKYLQSVHGLFKQITNP